MIKIDFDSGDFERQIFKDMERQLTTDFQKKLRAAGILGVTVKVNIPKHGDAGINLSGPDEEVQKAKKLLEEG